MSSKSGADSTVTAHSHSVTRVNIYTEFIERHANVSAQ